MKITSFESSADDFDSYRQTKEVKHTHCAVATIRGRSREGIITAFLVPNDVIFMKQPHDMLIEGNHEKLFQKSPRETYVLINYLLFGLLFGQSMAKKNKMENKLDFLDFRQFFFGELAKVLVDG